MFRMLMENDTTYNKKQAHFYLTQGDSCTIYLTPKKDGSVIDHNLIIKCLFKLSDDADNLEFEKQLTYDAQNEHYVLYITPEESAVFDIADHVYEFEYTLSGGEVNTPNRWTFTITDQIKS